MITNKKIIFFIILACSLFIANCTGNKEKTIKNYRNQLIKVGFDFKYWYSDTLGCDAKSKERNAKIFINQDFIKGCPKSIIIELLGKPYRIIERKDKVNLLYIIDGRLMCDNLKYRKVMRDTESSYLLISFDKDNQLLDTEIRIK